MYQACLHEGQESPGCHILSLGTMDYSPAWDLQRAIADEIALGSRPNTLLLLEHPHVYTLGRWGKQADLLLSETELAKLGAKVFWVDRGGEATYHGPGQLVGYPIVDLRPWGGPIKYVRTLEEVLIKTLAEFGIETGRIQGLTGVWAGEEKIASIGVKISRGITTHGFALNVCPNLSYFDHIVPCGIRDKGVTSMERRLGRGVEVAEAVSPLARHFSEEFGWETRWVLPDEVGLDVPFTTQRSLGRGRSDTARV